MAELLYTVDKMLNTQKVAKLLVYFGKLFEVVSENRSKYMQGSLFALGGLLKIEAKSYLKTMLDQKNEKSHFELECPLFDETSEMEKSESQRVRTLTSDD